MRDENVGVAGQAIGRRADLATRAAVLDREGEDMVAGDVIFQTAPLLCRMLAADNALSSCATRGLANSKLWISPESGSRREPSG